MKEVVHDIIAVPLPAEHDLVRLQILQREDAKLARIFVV